MMPHRCKSAFTIIELLVVIAIVALLISLLLPAVHKARIEARKAVSMSNLRQIGIAGAAYQNDNKASLPLTPPKGINGLPYQLSKGNYVLWCTWSAFGKNCDVTWVVRSPLATAHSGGSYYMEDALDMLAVHRPLNPYLYHGVIPGPTLGQTAIDLPTRKSFALPICNDPSDKMGHQQSYGLGNDVLLQKKPDRENNSPAASSYDDVGTSYQWTELWARQITNLIWKYDVLPKDIHGNYKDGPQFLFTTGNRLLQKTALPSEMVWLNDEHSKVVMRSQDFNIRFRNGYGDINKGVVAYLDGHVRYIPITPLGERDAVKWHDDPMDIPAFRNEYYTAGFEARDLPK